MILNMERPVEFQNHEAMDRVSDLVRMVQKGHRDAFGLLFEEYSGRVYRYVYMHTGQVEQAEDLTQEVFLRALNSIHSYRDQGTPFLAWLLRIAHNRVIDHYRWLARHRSVELADTVVTSAYDPVAQVEKKAEITKVLEAVPDLTPGQREVISLRFGSGLHLDETAAVMGKSVGAVKMLQHQAVERLKRMLEAKGEENVQGGGSAPITLKTQPTTRSN